MSFHVFVRDPPFALRPPPAEFGESVITGFDHPEGQLGFSLPYKNRKQDKNMIPRFPPAVENIVVVEPKAAESKSKSRSKSREPKKQRSLQSLFIPSFLQSPPPNVALPASSTQLSSRARSQSAPRRPSAATLITAKAKTTLGIRSGTPSRFLIDEDPFASVLSPPVPQSVPTSPVESSGSRSDDLLSPTKVLATEVVAPSLPVLPPPTPYSKIPRRPKSSGNGHHRGAYTKPAFTSRPSLPSLHTLAQMNVVIPKKVRKGTVGARLPHEPWNMDFLDHSSGPTSPGPAAPTSGGRLSKVDSVADFTLGLDADVPDLVNHLDLDDENDEDEQDRLPSSHDSMHDSIDTDSYEPSLSYTPSESDVSSFDSSRSSSFTKSSASSWSALDQLVARHSRSSQSPSSPPENQSEYPNSYDNTHNDYTFERYPDHDPLQSEPDFDYYWEPDTYINGKSESGPRASSPSWDVGRTPHSSVYQTEELSESPVEELTKESAVDNEADLGTSAGTIRSGLHDLMRPDSPIVPLHQDNPEKADGPQDSSGWDRGRRGGGGDQNYRRDRSTGRDNNAGRGSGGGSGSGGFGGRGLGSGGGGRDRDEDDRRRRHTDIKSSVPNQPDSSDEDQETGTDDYGVQSPAKRIDRARAPKPAPGSPTTGTDDDVPLAQRIPTALKAQKTIRRQVRDERDQRRRERAEAAAARKTESTLPPQGLATASQAIPSRSVGRPRTRTLPSSTTRPFQAEDLTQKLLGVQAAGSTSAAMLQPVSPLGRDASSPQETLNKRFLSPQPEGPSTMGKSRSSRPGTADSSSGDRSLRPMRSLRGLSAAAAQLPAEPAARGLSRSATGTRPRRQEDGYLSSAPPTSFHADARYIGERPKSRRTSEEGGRQGYSSGRPSAEYNTGQRSASRPPMPPLPPAEVLSNMALQSPPKVALMQQRIFVGDKQRYKHVETSNSTTAGEVVQAVEREESLEKLGAGAGGWMLWEVSQDFGIERPIRDYELLSEVESSWNKDKMINIFVVKRSPLSVMLSRSAVPTSSPRSSGYIDWESKKGKWSKRYMELREHSLWLSKKDGKDENFLCALSNFDAYYVAQRKAPKPFVFAVKSTENISLFENTSDYVHYFCCGQREGETWMQAILLARSYVLYQERNVLFSGANGSSSAHSKPLARSGTRKIPAQPLVDVSAALATANNPQTAVFEPGSLLAKRGDV